MRKILLLSIALAAIVGCTKNDADSHRELTLSEKTLAMQVPDEKLLSVVSPAEYASNPNLVWTSTKPEVASVDQKGNVTALAPGSTKIYAFVEGLDMVTGYCDVNVSEKMATTLKVNIDKTTLNAGESATATYTYTPAIGNSDVAIIQSDSVGMKIVESKIEVDSDKKQTGKLTFKALYPGKVKILVHNKLDEKTAEEITMTVNAVAMTSFKLKKEVTAVALDAKNVKLETEILPKEAAYRNILYKTLNPDILQVAADGTLIPISEGWAEVYVSTDDNVSFTCVIEVEKGKEGTVKFKNDTIDMVARVYRSYSEYTIPEISVSGSSKVTLRVDGNYTPKKGNLSYIDVYDGEVIAANFGTAGTGWARVIAESGVLDKDGKPIADSCIIHVVDVADQYVLPKPVYKTSDFDTKTTVVAYLNNFAGGSLILSKATLYIAKGTDKLKENKVLQTLNNINLAVEYNEPAGSVAFNAQKTLQSEISGYRVEYTYIYEGVEYTVDRAVVKDNGASFVAPR